jgi:MFS transporter, Spinster family, sphingosine-1-phosphate transporter
MMVLNLLNYADRSVLSALESKMEPDFFAAGATGWFGRSSAFWMGMLMTAFLVVYMVTAPIFGILADRWRRWAIVGLGVIGGGMASAGTGMVSTFGMLLVMRMLVGLSEAAYGPAAPTLISDTFPLARRGLALSLFYMAIPVGSALGYIYGGWMLSFTGKWQPAFWWLLAPALIFGIWCLFLKDPPRGGNEPNADGSPPTPSRTATWADYKLMLKTPSYLYNCAGQTLMTFAIGGIAFWMPRFCTERIFNPDPALDAKANATAKFAKLAEVNFLFGIIVVLAGLTATIFGGWLADRLRPKYPGSYLGLSGACMLLGFPVFLAMLWAPFPLAWIFLGVSVFLLFMNTGPSNTALANVTHPAVRASAFALNIFIIHALGDAISPPIMGEIQALALSRNYFGISSQADALAFSFSLVAVAILMSGIVWIIGAKHLDPDTKSAGSKLAPPPASPSTNP